jgi:hypothetical protein
MTVVFASAISEWRIRDVNSGSNFFPSRIRLFSIPDLNCLNPGSSSKSLSILTPKKAKKWFLSSKKYDPSCSSRIRMLTFSLPGSRGQKSTQSGIRIRNTDMYREDDFMFYDRLTTVWWRLNFGTFKCFLMSSLVITRFDLSGNL